ncbi:hypothetical protein HPB48_008543 [Haemaphysalis longicornis]|uniref:Uncharacterized protein n=1 Tax=Haemaphysalis longicornis TaxID=44386 RepID=A0A9J6FNX0_HAELO|nr:hypothetical protein HPB48_008543 [Haemaphysalis longicornis]
MFIRPVSTKCSPGGFSQLVWPRYFVLLVNDVLAAYQVWLQAVDVFFDGDVKLSFAHVQLLVSLLASVISGHIFMSVMGKARKLQLPQRQGSGGVSSSFIPTNTRTLLIFSFVLFAALDVLARSFKPFRLAAMYSSKPVAPANASIFHTLAIMAARKAAASGPMLSLSAQQLKDLVCFYVTSALKMGAVISYVQLVEGVQAAIRSLAITSHRTGAVVAHEVQEMGASLSKVLQAVHSLETAFSFLVLVWYAELMLAIVASVHIGLSFVENSRSFWANGTQLPRNLHLLSVYALLSHRLCAVHGESRVTAFTLGTGFSSRADPHRGPVCAAVKLLRRCAASGEAFALTAWGVFDLDDHFYMNTIKSVIMYGVILQQLTTSSGQP